MVYVLWCIMSFYRYTVYHWVYIHFVCSVVVLVLLWLWVRYSFGFIRMVHRIFTSFYRYANVSLGSCCYMASIFMDKVICVTTALSLMVHLYVWLIGSSFILPLCLCASGFLLLYGLYTYGHGQGDMCYYGS